MTPDARRVATAACAAALLAAGAARAEEPPRTGPVVVEATADATPLARANRPVVVIDREEIERAPVASVQELLAHVAGVEVRTRGPAGVQADVSIRGASFEQTVVLVDGVRVTDPQTGHHLLDVPVALAQIERIEVLRGQGSSLWGPNAVGGVVNIITRRPEGREAALGAAAGDHGLLEGSARLAAPTGPVAHRVALEARRSDGYRHNTDFETQTASWTAEAGAGPWRAALAAGWNRKDFGANGFYSERYPEQREATETTLLRGSLTWTGEALVVTPAVSWRRHDDDYVLDDTVHGPGRYENHHTTDVAGGRVEAMLQSAIGASAFAVEAAVEEIESSRLGDHSRSNVGLSAEHAVDLGAGSLRAGLSGWRSSQGWGWEVSPGVDASWRLGGGVTWHAALERAFRVPTYTELHYESPAQRGNPELGPERAWTAETGVRRGRALAWGATVFVRRGTDLIDWVRAAPEEPWAAANVARVTTRGVEAGVAWRPGEGWLRRLGLDYAWLDSDRGALEGESRYVLDHLRHQAVLRIDHRLPLGLEQGWWARYEEPLRGAGEVVVDAATRRRWGAWSAALEVTNLFGAGRERFPGVPLPGRWVLLRVGREFARGGG